MPEINLTQSEADALIAMEKRRADSLEYDFPELGGGVSSPLISADRRENFLLDLSRGRIDLAKIRYQHRARQILAVNDLFYLAVPVVASLFYEDVVACSSPAKTSRLHRLTLPARPAPGRAGRFCPPAARRGVVPFIEKI